MYPRYTHRSMTAIWSDEEKFRIWYLIESLIIRARSVIGEIPHDVFAAMPDQISIDPAEIDRIENAGGGHDVVAFLEHTIPMLPESVRGRYHENVTSYDLNDTTMGYQLKRSCVVIRELLRELIDVLRDKAFTYQFEEMMGRTHGVHAERITVGTKFAVWCSQLGRQLLRLDDVAKRVAVGKISGVVGMYKLDPRVEEMVCAQLGLTPVPATQIVGRDIPAEYLDFCANLVGTLDQIATAVRLGQQTERREFQEPFRKEQKGSSAMPHKRNPVGAENVCSLARIVRAYAHVGHENQSTWDERSLDNSAAERIILPGSSHLVAYLLARLTRIMKDLIINRAQIAKNLALTAGLTSSQSVVSLLAEKSGMGRQEAYDIVREIAQTCFDENVPFRKGLLDDTRVSQCCSAGDIDECLKEEIDPEHVEYIFRRVFGP